MGPQPLLGVLLLVALGLALLAGGMWRRARDAEAEASRRMRALKVLGAAAGQVAAAPTRSTGPVVSALEGLCFERVDVLVLDEPTGRWLCRTASGQDPEHPDSVVGRTAQRSFDLGAAIVTGVDDQESPRLVACPVPSEAVEAVIVARCPVACDDAADVAAVEAFAGLLGASGTAFDQALGDRDVPEQRPRGPVDSLTGLGSSAAFLAALQKRCEDRSSPVALLLVAVDGVETVARDLGARSADEVIRIAARRLRRCLRPDDEVARTAPTIFGVLLGVAEDPDGAAAVGARALEVLDGPVAVTSGDVRVSARVSVVWDATGRADAETLLPDALDALSRADGEVVTSIRLGDPTSVAEPDNGS